MNMYVCGGSVVKVEHARGSQHVGKAWRERVTKRKRKNETFTTHTKLRARLPWGGNWDRISPKERVAVEKSGAGRVFEREMGGKSVKMMVEERRGIVLV